MTGRCVNHQLGWALALGMVCGVGLGCSQTDEGDHPSHSAIQESAVHVSTEAEGTVPMPMTQEFQAGEERFNMFCSRCHGKHARGTRKGPPLVHKIYEPSHHGDSAFLRATAQGVRSHHWDFGDMPKIADVSSDDVKVIIQYIRWLQRQAEIY